MCGHSLRGQSPAPRNSSMEHRGMEHLEALSAEVLEPAGIVCDQACQHGGADAMQRGLHV